MKKIIKVIIFFILSSNIALAIENADSKKPASLEPIYLEAESNQLNIETDKNVTTTSNENKLLEGKILKDVELGAAIKASTNFLKDADNHKTHNLYGVPVSDFWIKLMFNDERETHLKFMINPFRDTDGYSYMGNIFSDIYVETTPFKNHRLLVGQSRTPIGMEGGASQYTLLLDTRSMIARNFGNIRAMGVKLKGDYDLFDYNIGIYDSSRFMYDMFNGSEFTGWANYKPLGKTDGKYGNLAIGGGVNTGKHNKSYTVVGGAINYEYKKWLFNAEYAYANGYNGPDQGVAAQTAEGFYSTIAYYIHPKVQLVGRVDMFDPDKHISNNNIQEYTVGANYYIKESKFLVGLNYVYRNMQNGPESNRFVLYTQILFY